MEHQQFGAIEINNKRLEVMFCVDADRPSEAMLHWWGQDVRAMAMLTHYESIIDQSVKLMPKLIFRTSDSGGLFPPSLRSGEEDGLFNTSNITLVKNDDYFEGVVTACGYSGTIRLNSLETSPLLHITKCGGWRDFKDWVTTAKERDDAILFRGHGDSTFRLETTFHRAGFRRLERFCSEIFREFYLHAEVALNQRFDLNDATDFSMLLGLAQHHGLPTPLLDFTRSPYIAAFFAFNDAIESLVRRPEANFVRVYGLTRQFVLAHNTPIITLPYYKPYISPLAVSGRNNPRLYAQQGQFLVTNVANIEGFIRVFETKTNSLAMIAADIPITCANEALEDLYFMGLSASSLFPGLDGICRMLKHRLRFKNP